MPILGYKHWLQWFQREVLFNKNSGQRYPMKVYSRPVLLLKFLLTHVARFIALILHIKLDRLELKSLYIREKVVNSKSSLWMWDTVKLHLFCHTTGEVFVNSLMVSRRYMQDFVLETSANYRTQVGRRDLCAIIRPLESMWMSRLHECRGSSGIIKVFMVNT